MDVNYQSRNDDIVENISTCQASQFIHTMAFSRKVLLTCFCTNVFANCFLFLNFCFWIYYFYLGDSCSDNDSGICSVDSGSEQSCSSPKCSLPTLVNDKSRILPKTTTVPTL